ncbi:MAG: hypothetical protein K2P67_07640 [Gallionellaceae bacterium]|nr:hypothetical protein [Gallionellaceae bacterium]
MTSPEQTADLPDNLPLLTEVVGEGAADDFPLLTEVATEAPPETNCDVVAPEAGISEPCAISTGEMQEFLRQIETHLETVLMQKLNFRIEQLQRQAIEQAVNELKVKLPELLRDALSANPRQ